MTEDDPMFFGAPLPGRRKRQSSPPLIPTFDQLNISDEVREFCGNISACVYDFTVTGNMDAAGTTRDFIVNTTNMQEQLST